MHYGNTKFTFMVEESLAACVRHNCVYHWFVNYLRRARVFIQSGQRPAGIRSRMYRRNGGGTVGPGGSGLVGGDSIWGMEAGGVYFCEP